MICRMKKIDNHLAITIIIFHINKGNDELAIPYVKEVAHVSSYPLLESMVFDTDISDGVT